jgi:hypothetical protein
MMFEGSRQDKNQAAKQNDKTDQQHDTGHGRVNSAISPRRRQKTGTMTRIVLLISFIILFSRLMN